MDINCNDKKNENTEIYSEVDEKNNFIYARRYKNYIYSKEDCISKIKKEIKPKCENYNFTFKIDKQSALKGDVIELNFDCMGKEECINVNLEELKYLKFDGSVTDKDGNVVREKKVILYKAQIINYKTEYVPICEVMTDEYGLFEGVIYNAYGDNHYTIKIEE